ncbi:HAD family hydrolase [Flavobacterium salilacus subsp. salilacus]|uniref:HAD family hydrolase n=1 Tax=Flavobacterium TaxID=237 RepID=UPI00107549DB|nr:MULTISPECIES: HAD hydrolase-like protein [Flavobacterium]KAF2519771.1 HAD family hydrolase [Flavobacterium salilacus subsp. salilacus]MBE1614333.1 HAD family hydrolase [Flavobacterium sp. SaA2.13]
MSRYKEIIWDFDGVILLSDAVREYGFRKVFENHSNELVQKLIDYHLQNGGLSRYVKIKYFYENVLGEPITEEQINKHAEEFSVIMREALTDRKLINKEWVSLMEEIGNKFVHSIASGSDGKELNYLCGELGISDNFKFIYGSPITKKELVRQIITDSDFEPSEFILIGDAINDRDAAQANNISFIGYHNDSLKDSELYVDDLRDVLKILY